MCYGSFVTGAYLMGIVRLHMVTSAPLYGIIRNFMIFHLNKTKFTVGMPYIRGGYMVKVTVY